MIKLEVIFLLGFIAALGGTRLLIWFLRKRQIMDVPNDRSNHKIPTPRGGGLVIVAVLSLLLGAVIYHYPLAGYQSLIIIPCILLLATISWIDDVRNLPVKVRLLTHFLAAAVTLALFPADKLIFQGVLPFFLDRLLACLLWVWFMNLYNFMDGIDGMAGTESLSISIGIALLVVWSHNLPDNMVYYSAAISAAVMGFLVWNWHPAKIFMGDVGSIPLGYIIGWLLLVMASNGLLAAALILPAYYLADSGITLLKRMIERKNIWEAHSEHFYQQAVRAGASHADVVVQVIKTNIMLIGLAFFATYNNFLSWIALTATVFVVSVLLIKFRLYQKRKSLSLWE